MKNNKLITLMFAAAMTFLYSCSKDETEAITDASKNYEHSYEDPESGEIKYFETIDELVESLKGTKYYELAKEKQDELATEIEYIEEHKLYDLPEDNILVKNYAKSLEQKAVNGSFLYDADDCRGKVIAYGNSSRWKLGKGKRNRISSIAGNGFDSGFITLYDKSFFRGSSHTVYVTPFSCIRLAPYFDNKANSFR